MEKRTEVKVFQVDLHCDTCQQIMVSSSDTVLMSHPPKYKYECKTCKTSVLVPKSYPHVVYESVPVRADTGPR